MLNARNIAGACICDRKINIERELNDQASLTRHLLHSQLANDGRRKKILLEFTSGSGVKNKNKNKKNLVTNKIIGK